MGAMKTAGRCPTCAAGVGALVAEDLRRSGHPLRSLAEVMILEPVGRVLLYRLSHAAYWSPLRPLGWIARAVSLALYGADIRPRACLGRRLHVAHVNGIVIGGGVTTGDDLKLFARVTLGAGGHYIWPEAGSRVTLFIGACVAGPARLGDGSRVGANVFFDGVLRPAFHRVPAGRRRERLRAVRHDAVSGALPPSDAR